MPQPVDDSKLYLVLIYSLVKRIGPVHDPYLSSSTCGRHCHLIW